MEAVFYCTKCNKSSKRHFKNSDEFDRVQNGFECNECRAFVHTNNYSKNLVNLLDPISVTKQTAFYYFNNDILYDINKEKQTNPSLFDTYSTKTVLLVGTGLVRKFDLLKRLLSLGIKRFVCLCRENYMWCNDNEYFNDWIYAEHENIEFKESTLNAVKDFMKKNNNLKFDAVITYMDASVLMTSYLAESLNLIGIPFEIVDKTKNKYEFRNVCKELNINCPKYFVLKSTERQNYLNRVKKEEDENLDEQSKKILKSFTNDISIPYPVIAKHPYGTGKDFVKKCNSNKDLIDVLNDSIKLFKDADLLIEEFYEGHEIDVDILIQNNEVKFLSISDNFPPLEPYFFEQGGMSPSVQLSSREKEAIEYLVKKWLGKLNLQNACLHFEAKCKPKSIYKDVNMFDENSNLIDESNFLMPIEINLRIGGAETWSMIKAAYDVDLMQEVLNIGLGIELNKDLLYFKSKNPTYQCISKDFHPAKNVLIKSIEFDQDLFKKDGVVNLAITRCVGDRLNPRDFMGWLTIKTEKNSTLEQLESKRNELLNHIRFDFENY